MSASTVFTILLALVLLRVFWVKLKASNAHSENFKNLAPKDKLAVLKECLLNNPTEANLQNLAKFAAEQKLDLDAESYRPFMKAQLELRGKPNAIEEDNELFVKEAAWLDQIRPLEFAEAEQLKSDGEQDKFIAATLEGTARLYSDKAIFEALETLREVYPKATSLSESYSKLVELREQSGADEKSLEILRKAKDAWESDLLNVEI